MYVGVENRMVKDYCNEFGPFRIRIAQTELKFRIWIAQTELKLELELELKYFSKTELELEFSIHRKAELELEFELPKRNCPHPWFRLVTISIY